MRILSKQQSHFETKIGQPAWYCFKLIHRAAYFLVVSMIQLGCGVDPVLTPLPPELELRTANIKIKNYCPNKPEADAASSATGSATVTPTLFTYKDIFAFNTSTYKTGNTILKDTDRDGLEDQIETEYKNYLRYNLDPLKNDTNNDGYSDLIMYKMKFDQNKQAALNAECQIDRESDDDLDGLRNCEEALLGTNADAADTDADGIPDGLEFRFGTNLLQYDSDLDPDLDGLTNLQEIKQNTPHLQSNTPIMGKFATKYKIYSFADSEGYQCYNITAKDIPLLDLPNGNFISITITEGSLASSVKEELRIRTVKILVPGNFSQDGQIIIDGVRDQCYGGGLTDTYCNEPLVVTAIEEDERVAK